jgi:hypothetical protein
MTHRLIIESIGDYPTAKCACGKWAYVTSAKPQDTPESKMALLREMHEKHQTDEKSTKP